MSLLEGAADAVLETEDERLESPVVGMLTWEGECWRPRFPDFTTLSQFGTSAV